MAGAIWPIHVDKGLRCRVYRGGGNASSPVGERLTAEPALALFACAGLLDLPTCLHMGVLGGSAAAAAADDDDDDEWGDGVGDGEMMTKE